MKNYTITVNGNMYDVTVEETAGTGMAAAAPRPMAAPVQAPKAAPAAAGAGTEGSIKVNAPMPGKILAVKVNVGDTVKKGQVLVILEAMKMENEIGAPEDGTVAGIHTKDGTTVEAGDLLVSLN